MGLNHFGSTAVYIIKSDGILKQAIQTVSLIFVDKRSKKSF